jgi:hypothetical protein
MTSIPLEVLHTLHSTFRRDDRDEATLVEIGDTNDPQSRHTCA